MRKTYLIILIQLLLLGCISVWGQDNKQVDLDSLLTELGEKTTSPGKLEVLLAIIEMYADDDPSRALQYSSAALIEAENSKDMVAKAAIFQRIGSIYEGMENFDPAIDNYLMSLELYSTLGIDQEKGNIYYDLADVYKKKGLYKLSFENCLKGLDIFEELNDKAGLSDIYNCMGSLYKYQNDQNSALDYYGKSLSLNIESGDSSGISMAYNNIGVVHALLGNTDLALDYYIRSIQSAPSRGDEKNTATTLGNISSLMLTQERFDEAFKYLNESLAMNIELGYQRGIANQYRTMGRYYDLTGDPDLAIKYLLKAYNIHKELGRLESEKDITQYLSDLYYRMGRYKEAYDFSHLFKAYSDSIFNIEKMKSIAQLENNYILQKEDEIHLLKDQKRRVINMLLILALFLVIIIITLYYYQQKSKIKGKNLEILNKDLEMKQVISDLDTKQRELAASTIYMVRKNELINDVIRRLTDAKSNLKEENVPIINNIIQDLSSGTELDIWKEFEIRFLQVNRGFYDNLQAEFPELTTNEKRLSAFLKLDFSTKEIATITRQSPHSINIARTRLRKKLGLANSEVNLANFLSKF